jgi:hypothetical protein
MRGEEKRRNDSSRKEMRRKEKKTPLAPKDTNIPKRLQTRARLFVGSDNKSTAAFIAM